MSLFTRAFEYTLQWEGGFDDDPDDPGGATNLGVSLRAVYQLDEIDRFDYNRDGDVTPDEIRQIRRQDAAAFYADHFWEEWLNQCRQPVAIKLFDFGVNMGPRQRNRLLQRALWIFGHTLIVDGIVGPVTLDCLKATTGGTASAFVLSEIESQAARFYFEICERRSASRKYLFGWLRRCYARPEVEDVGVPRHGFD